MAQLINNLEKHLINYLRKQLNYMCNIIITINIGNTTNGLNFNVMETCI